jgi:hypothetical protein
MGQDYKFRIHTSLKDEHYRKYQIYQSSMEHKDRTWLLRIYLLQQRPIGDLLWMLLQFLRQQS